MAQKKTGNSPPIPDDFLICPECAREMGYRHPYPLNLDRFKARCGHCDKLTATVRKVDLFPPDEDIPFDGD